jgi:hypothetical protein
VGGNGCKQTGNERNNVPNGAAVEEFMLQEAFLCMTDEYSDGNKNGDTV